MTPIEIGVMKRRNMGFIHKWEKEGKLLPR